MGKLPENFTNAARVKFVPEALIVGGPSMSEGRSIEQQIADAPLRALTALTMDWGTYKTSVLDQFRFIALAQDRLEARQVAQGAILEQIAQAMTKGVDVIIDYDEIEKRIAANMPDYKVIAVTHEGDKE